MKFGGLIKFTLIDFPGRPAAVVFTQGCNFRCRYCHNPELVYPHLFAEPVAEEEIYSFLKRRQGTLEGVVVSGGEPTLHEDLKNGLRHKVRHQRRTPGSNQKPYPRKIGRFYRHGSKSPV